MPGMQLARHTKSSTLYGRSFGLKSKFFRPDGLLIFRIIMGRAPLLYKTLLIIEVRYNIFKAKRGADEWFQCKF